MECTYRARQYLFAVEGNEPIRFEIFSICINEERNRTTINMALILNIDTSSDYASIALSMDGKLVELMKNPEVRDHASWVHQGTHELLIKCGYTLQDLQAIAVTGGPGSYTGLRIGMSTAKGLCYV